MGPTPQSLDRLTASDLFLLRWDDYGWCSDIGAFAILDGFGMFDSDGRVAIELVRRHVEARLHLIPRFRQRLHKPPRGLGWPLWVDTPEIDLAAHVRIHQLPEPANEDTLLRACAELAPDRPRALNTPVRQKPPIEMVGESYVPMKQRCSSSSVDAITPVDAPVAARQHCV